MNPDLNFESIIISGNFLHEIFITSMYLSFVDYNLVSCVETLKSNFNVILNSYQNCKMEHKRTDRGIPLSQQRLWMYAIEKESKLRLKWFKRNETRLDEIANKVHMRQVPEEVKEEMKQRMLNYFQRIDRKCVVVQEPEPPIVEEAALHSVMRPVDKGVKDLLFASTINDGRKTYLQERYKVIPEQKYYFPETTNFRYGWNVWEITKDIGGSPYARQQVIKESFYRRRGVDRDPEWYKEPARLSPQVCGRI